VLSLVAIWRRTHSVDAALACLAVVAGLSWVVALTLGSQPLANPLGDSFVAVRMTLFLPVAGAALVPVLLQDRVDPAMSLAARSLRTQRAGWWCLAQGALVTALAPLEPALGRTQLLIDAGLLVAVSTFALCRLGLGIATAMPMLVLLPHLLRHAGAAPAWWTVLDSAYPTETGVVTGLAAVTALGVYAVAGPQPPIGLAGGSPE
jgi:hypothetical protein